MKRTRAFLFVLVVGLILWANAHQIRLCPIYRLFHRPCPGCGLTRAFLLLFQGKLRQSLAYHPLALPLLLSSLLYGGLYWTGRSSSLDAWLLAHRRLIWIGAFLLTFLLAWHNWHNPLLYD